MTGTDLQLFQGGVQSDFGVGISSSFVLSRVRALLLTNPTRAHKLQNKGLAGQTHACGATQPRRQLCPCSGSARQLRTEAVCKTMTVPVSAHTSNHTTFFVREARRIIALFR